MKTISKTKIPTVHMLGPGTGYVWNPIRGCKCHCLLHPKWKGKNYPSAGKCWAANYCRRFSVQLAKNEIEYLRKTRVPRPDDDPDHLKYLEIIIEKDLFDFSPQLFSGELEKKFPKKRSCIFACSQTDIGWVEKWQMEMVLKKIKRDNRHRREIGERPHVFQFLTKRPWVYHDYEFPENAWLGVTCRTQREINYRCATLSEIKTKAKKYLYIEPMIDVSDISKFVDLGGIEWVVCGGPGHSRNGLPRVHQVIGISDYCLEHGVPFFFKSWGKGMGNSIVGKVYEQFPVIP